MMSIEEFLHGYCGSECGGKARPSGVKHRQPLTKLGAIGGKQSFWGAYLEHFCSPRGLPAV